MLNQCQFIGRIAADVETRSMKNGNQVANFTLAVGEKYKDKNGVQQEVVEWVRVCCFSEGLIKVLERYVKKGDMIFISGKMKTRSWEDQSGQKKYATEIVMQGFDSKLVMLGGKSDSQPKTADDWQAPGKQESPSMDDFEDEIPF